MAEALNILTICGSLRKNSSSRAGAARCPRWLFSFVGAGLSIKPAPSAGADSCPIYMPIPECRLSRRSHRDDAIRVPTV